MIHFRDIGTWQIINDYPNIKKAMRRFSFTSTETVFFFVIDPYYENLRSPKGN